MVLKLNTLRPYWKLKSVLLFFFILIQLLHRLYKGYSIKKVSRGDDHTPKKILWVGGLKKIAILRVGGPKNFTILRVGGIIRPPHIEVCFGNSTGGWSEQFCNSAGGWSEKKMTILRVGRLTTRVWSPSPLTFLME